MPIKFRNYSNIKIFSAAVLSVLIISLLAIVVSTDNAVSASETSSNKVASYTGPLIKAGSTVCEKMKSMYKVNALARANNPYVSIPYDCVKISKSIPVMNTSSYAGLVKIEIKGNGRILQLWTSDDNISH